MKKWAVVSFLFFCLFVPAASSVDRDLILAVAKGRFKTVQELVEKKKANVNATYDKGKTSLHWAVISGDLKMVAYLMAKGAKLEVRDDYGDTPLHKAALRQSDVLDIVKYLVLMGADINAVNRYGWTPLHYFSYYDNSLMVKYLIMQEALLTNMTTRKYMDITNGLTAYDITVQKHNTNSMLALENPDHYRQLSKTPYLMLSISNDFGPENMLTGPSKGRLILRVENRGGAYASSVYLTAELATNTVGVLIGGAQNFSLGIGASYELSLPVEATREAKDGLVEVRITLKETSFNKETGPVTYRFRTRSPRPPVLSLVSLAPTNQRPVLNGLEKTLLSWIVEDRLTNSGYADNLLFSIVPVSNCAQIGFSEISNVTLVPGEKKQLNLEISGGEDLKDGLAKILAVATDLQFKVSASNYLVIEKRRLMRPRLIADHFFNISVDEKTVTNAVAYPQFSTNMAEVTNITVSNETVQTVEVVQTNWNSSNEIVTLQMTNRDSGIILKNFGEGPARNVTVSAQAILPDAIGLSNTTVGRTQVYLYNVPEIGTNMMVRLPFGNYIFSATTNVNILNVKWADDRKLSVFETNFTVELK